MITDAEDNNLNLDVNWVRWLTCSLCEQDYHGAVQCALGWACWKTHLGRPEANGLQMSAMAFLANGLYSSNMLEESLAIYAACHAMTLRYGFAEDSPECISIRANMANCHADMGNQLESLDIFRKLHKLKLRTNEEELCLSSALSLSISLVENTHYAEAKELASAQISVCQRVHGAENHVTLKFRSTYAEAMANDPAASLDDLIEAEETLADVGRVMKRVLGISHNETQYIYDTALPKARTLLARACAVAQS